MPTFDKLKSLTAQKNPRSPKAQKSKIPEARKPKNSKAQKPSSLKALKAQKGLKKLLYFMLPLHQSEIHNALPDFKNSNCVRPELFVMSCKKHKSSQLDLYIPVLHLTFTTDFIVKFLRVVHYCSQKQINL